jgi:hypothetical protein
LPVICMTKRRRNRHIFGVVLGCRPIEAVRKRLWYRRVLSSDGEGDFVARSLLLNDGLYRL